jgi:hypothetical protein
VTVTWIEEAMTPAEGLHGGREHVAGLASVVHPVRPREEAQSAF